MRAVALALAGVLLASPALAQSYPNRPVRVVSPYPPGGSVDAVGRIVSQKLGEALGQNFFVDNRAGANGTVGADFVAKAAPDGYTLMITASIHVVTPLLSKNVPYDAVKDFTAVTQIAEGPLLFLAHPGIAPNNLGELAQQAKADPRKFTFATSGIGSAGHMAEETWKRLVGVDILIAPYRGSAPALNDIVGGHVNLMIEPILSSLPLVQGGKLKALAVTSPRRVSVAPEIPTVAEAGMPGFDFFSWYGVWGPKGMPADVIAKLNDEVARIVKQPEVRERLSAQGFEVVESSPALFAKYIDEEVAKYARIIKDADIKMPE